LSQTPEIVNLDEAFGMSGFAVYKCQQQFGLFDSSCHLRSCRIPSLNLFGTCRLMKSSHWWMISCGISRRARTGDKKK
jgi:hypothetical protein